MDKKLEEDALMEEKKERERKRREKRIEEKGGPKLGNKPRKKEIHHQELPWIKSLKRML